MGLNWAPFVLINDLNFQGVANLHQAFSGFSQTYRIISISGYGHPNDPKFAVIWAARPEGAPRQILRAFQGEASPPGAFAEGSDKYYPVLVAAVGKKGFAPQFVVVAEERKPSGGLVLDRYPVLKVGLSIVVTDAGANRPDTGTHVRNARLSATMGLGKIYADARRGLLTPLVAPTMFALGASVARYRDGQGQIRFAATFLPQPADGFIPWGIDVAFDEAEEKQKQKAYATSPAPARLEQLVRIHDDATLDGTVPRFLQLWNDSVLPGGWIPARDLDQKAYDDTVSLVRKTYGFYPIRVDVFDDVSPRRYNVIFASTDEPIARTFRPKAKGSTFAPVVVEPVAFSKWDDWAEVLMRDNGFRGMQLAITYQGRLVFYRAYTRAELGYPDIQLDTSINVGSVSKALTTLAVLRLLDQESATLDELKQALKRNFWDEMGIASPPGGNNPRLLSLRLGQLITQTSGISLNTPTEADDIVIASLTNKTLPLESNVAWEYFRGLGSVPMVPAGQSILSARYAYRGTNAFLLERWLEKKTGTNSGLDAMKAALFDVVGATNAHISGSGNIGAKEAIRHRNHMESEVSHLQNDLAIGPSAYRRRSMELVAPSGGWSMPADDLARVVASVDWGANPGRTPLLSPRGIDRLETVVPFVVSADNGNSVKITDGGWYETPWNQAGATALSHNGDIDGAQALIVRINNSALGGPIGVTMLFTGHFVGSNMSGFRAPGAGDAASLLSNLPGSWPSWDLFAP